MVGASFVSATVTILRARRDFYRSGNTVISTAQSKFGGSSIYFDGTDDWLETKYGIELTGDFTLEGWVYLPNVSGIKSFMTIGTENTGRVDFMIENAALKYDIYAATYATSSGSISTNTWTHIAYVRSGSTLTFYIGGTSQGTGTASGTIGRTDQIRIGQHTGTSEDFSGYIDELRLSNSARYTGNFTPSTTPFTNDANTLLLMHGNGTNNSTFFEDDNGSRSSRGIVSSGASTSTTQSKFGGTSASFSGTNYLAVYGDSTSTWALSGDLTVEFWFYQTSTSNATYIDSRNGGNSFALNILQVSQKLSWYAGGGMLIQESGTISTNTWTHCALVRSGSTFTLYKNGTSVGTYSSSSTFASQLTLAIGTANSPDFGANSSAHFQDEIRISNVARYTSNFTPATSPFVNDANTLLLIHADGTNAATVFRDDNGAGRASKGIQAIGNAAISTTQSKFGGTSATFDGTGDYLKLAGSSDWYLGTATTTWTIEGWIYFSSLPGAYKGIISCQTDAGNNGWGVYINNSNQLTWIPSAPSGTVSGSTAFTAATWQHWAVVRNGSSLKMYLGGTQIYSNASYTNYTDQAATDPLEIGRAHNISGGYNGYLEMSGYQDEIRISNIARYTAAFTPSTTPFQSDTNTLLLIHADGTNASTTFIDDNGIAPYTA